MKGPSNIRRPFRFLGIPYNAASVKRNLIANVAGTAWTGLVTLALAPLYVRCLGAEGYGLIGFYASVMVVVTLLDFGLGITVNRQFASAPAGDGAGTAWAMLRRERKNTARSS